MIIAGAVLVAAAILLGESFGYVRSLVGFAIGGTVLYLGWSYFRSAGASPPGHADLDIRPGSLKYVCSMCGLELRVEVEGSGRPPTHCRESMTAVATGD